MLKLLVIDAGWTLGVFDGLGTHELIKISPLPERVVREESRRFLHCAPEPTREVLEDFCEAIHVDYDQLPTDWTSNFTAYPYAADAVSTMIDATGATAVVLSNIPCTTGPSRMRALQSQLPMIKAVYTSYTMRRRKPDRRNWLDITKEHGVRPSEAVHIGDLWNNDVAGAIRAGCHAVFVAETRPDNAPPPRREWPAADDRIRVAGDLSDAVAHVLALHESVA